MVGKKVVLFISIAFIGSCSGKTKDGKLPDWVVSPLANCQEGFVCSVGEGGDILSASSNARSELAKQFSVRVKSSAVFEISQSNGQDSARANYSVDEQVDEVLSDIAVKEEKKKKKGTYYAFAVVDKEKMVQKVLSTLKEFDGKISSELALKPLPVGRLKLLMQKRDKENKKYIMLTGHTYPGSITIKDIKNAKGNYEMYKLDLIKNDDLNIKGFIQSKVISHFDKISKDAEKIISGKVNVVKQHLNVSGFEKYEVEVVLTCKKGNKKLGSIEVIRSETGRSKQHVIDKVKADIFDEIDKKIDDLLM